MDEFKSAVNRAAAVAPRGGVVASPTRTPPSQRQGARNQMRKPKRGYQAR